MNREGVITRLADIREYADETSSLSTLASLQVRVGELQTDALNVSDCSSSSVSWRTRMLKAPIAARFLELRTFLRLKIEELEGSSEFSSARGKHPMVETSLSHYGTCANRGKKRFLPGSDAMDVL